ncbi:MAG TPA: hypothetical protein PKM88_12275 [bacterium]|nr:hypothetical protein [bacterium]
MMSIILVAGNSISERNDMANNKKSRSERPEAPKPRHAGGKKKAELTVKDLEGVCGGADPTGMYQGGIVVTTGTITGYD